MPQQASDSPTEVRHFKLISVTFKETVLDSPSFRASANHLDHQVDNIENWLTALKSSARRFPKYIKDFQNFTSSFLEYLIPPFLQDGLMDQEYTVQSLNTSVTELKKLWTDSLKALSIDAGIIDEIHARISADISKYKDLRARFEATQVKYDRYLNIYLSSSKTKDAAMVLEDAKQLFNVRREYVHASLDMALQFFYLGNLLDKTLVRLSTSLWLRRRTSFNLDLKVDHSFADLWSKINRIQNWSDSFSSATDGLRKDLHKARTQVETSFINQNTPSTNVNDYRIASLNSKSIADFDEKGVEKHGYLFMKTYTSRSSKPAWVRRWAFIKSGLFGLLMLSPSKTFVQESDKIGILLCKVDYALNEERRFCFEVKTVDVTIVFQAETLTELKSWIKVFENEKNRILNEKDVEQSNIASGRYPPLIAEFASTLNTSMDRELTNTKIVNGVGQIITSSDLSSYIQKNEKYFQEHVYYQIPQIRPPFSTETTKSSIIAYSLSAATTLPSALTANIWGSVNWGLYYLQDTLEEKVADVDQSDLSEETPPQGKNFESGINYPLEYPDNLVPLDIQMRALLETAIEPGELCLLSFRCIWAPNSKQELSGRFFVTRNHVYSYIQAFGFISLFKGSVDRLVAVEYAPHKKFDLVKLFNVNGLTRMKLFLDSGKVIKEKLMLLINNKAKEKPEGNVELIKLLTKIDEDFEKERIEAKTHPKGDGTPNVPSFLLQDKNVSLKLDYSKNYLFISENIYNIPPKALFHVLLGDTSYILRILTPFIKPATLIKKAWHKSPEGFSRRKFTVPSIDFLQKKGDVSIEQNIESIVEDEYYNFTHSVKSFKFPLGGVLKLSYRIVIVGVSGNRTKMYFYAAPEFEKRLIFTKIFELLAYRICVRSSGKLDKTIQKSVRRLGTHGVVVNSIFLFGKLHHSDEAEESVPDVKPIEIHLLNLRFVIFKVLYTILAVVVGGFNLACNGIKSFMRAIRMNYVLIFMLMGSVLFNMFLIGRSTKSYWVVHKADKLAKKHLFTKPLMLQRAVYLNDTRDMLSSIHNIELYTNDTNSRCFNNFQDSSFVLNFHKTIHWDEQYTEELTRRLAQDLKKKLHEIGVNRHELMTKLRMLNKMEEEIGLAEWKTWLTSELQKCGYVANNIFGTIADANRSDLDSLSEGIDSIGEYCYSCSSDLEKLNLI